MEDNKTNLKFALPIGTVLSNGDNQYRIVKVLGAGGFGITYKVMAKIRLNNVVGNFFFAVKEFFMSGCDRADDGKTVVIAKSMAEQVAFSLNDFITEARRLNRLSGKSQNIVQVNEIFQENNTAYYVMEFLEGGNLQDIVQNEGAFNEIKAVNIISTVAKAVSVLHKEMILHQDIKPENIVMKHDQDNDRLIPVIIDFGISKHFNKAGAPTSTPLAKGASDGYAPIEQYARIERFQPAADVYALGATLLYLISGKTPANAFEITPQSIRNDIPDYISDNTVTVILNAMKKLMDERTPDVDEFIRQCQDILSKDKAFDDSSKQEQINSDSLRRETTTTKMVKGRNRNSNRTLEKDERGLRKWIFIVAAVLLVGALVMMFLKSTDSTSGRENGSNAEDNHDSAEVVLQKDSSVNNTTEEAENMTADGNSLNETDNQDYANDNGRVNLKIDNGQNDVKPSAGKMPNRNDKNYGQNNGQTNSQNDYQNRSADNLQKKNDTNIGTVSDGAERQDSKRNKDNPADAKSQDQPIKKEQIDKNDEPVKKKKKNANDFIREREIEAERANPLITDDED